MYSGGFILILVLIWTVSRHTLYNENELWTYNPIINELINCFYHKQYPLEHWFFFDLFTLRNVYLYINNYYTTFNLSWWFYKLITFNKGIIYVLGWFHTNPCQNYRMTVIPEKLGEGKRLDPNTFDPQFFKSILFLQKCSLLSLCNLVGVFFTCL